MANICDIYSTGIKRKLKNYWAAWLPTTKFQIGDVGILNGKYFEKIGSLKELKIDFKIEEDTSPSPIEIVSESGVSINFKIAGETNTAFPNIPAAEAGVKFKFGSAGAFAISCPESFEPMLAEPMALQEKIIDAFNKKIWQGEWSVITRVVTSPSATIVISNSKDSELELSSKADLKAGLADLGKANVEFSMKSQTGDMIKMIGAKDVTPFFQLASIKRRWLGPPKLRTRAMRLDDRVEVASIALSGKASNSDLYLDVLRDDEVHGV